MVSKMKKSNGDVCIHCGGMSCKCSQAMKVVTLVMGLILLWVAWSLWIGTWSLNEALAVIVGLWGLKKIMFSFSKACC